MASSQMNGKNKGAQPTQVEPYAIYDYLKIKSQSPSPRPSSEQGRQGGSKSPSASQKDSLKQVNANIFQNF